MTEYQRLRASWLAETLRLREALWGPLEDAAEVRRARAQGRHYADKVLLRAQYLGKREKLDRLIDTWLRGARIALALLCVLALMGGMAAAMGALGDGTRHVNLLLAVVALLGLNTVAFSLWLLSFLFKGSGSGAWLGESWLWLTHKLARGPDAALAPRALVELLSRNQSLRWLLGGVSHGLWILALASMLLTLLALLSARRYQFNWETTLLSPDAFVAVTSWLGWLPGMLGFTMPPEAIIRISDGLHTLPGSAQGLWSGWLMGCVVAYGLAPRLLALAVCFIRGKKALAAVGPDAGLPGYAELRERLSPSSERVGIDAPDGPGFLARIPPRTPARHLAGQPMLAGIELPPDTPWPPADLPHGIADAGIIDNRSQRKALLDDMQQQTPSRLLLVCDAQQTPDRGTLALLADLAGLADEAHIALHTLEHDVDDGTGDRLAAWHDRLRAAGFAPEQIARDPSAGLAWLGQGHATDDATDPAHGTS